MHTDTSLQRLSLWLMAASLTVVLAFYGLPEVVHRVTLAVEQGRSEAAGVQLRRLGDTSEVFRLVARRVGPSVVNVSTVTRPRSRLGLLGRLYGDEPYGLVRQGEGSGLIIDARGYILTNDHVVRGADRIQVRFSHGTEQLARIVGSDPHTDLAVLKVEAEGLVAAEFGDSDQVEVGDWVLAIGNPFGLEQSVTAGIVSAKGRSNIVEELDVQDFLQTDAAINPGNSGGPLVDLHGRVIGVNSVIWSQSGGYQGISFAIPSKIAQSVAERLIQEGKVTRAWLGIRGSGLGELPAGTRKPDGLKTTVGILVSVVLPNSPAARAGLAVGDVIVSIAGRRVQTLQELRAQLATAKVGSAIPLETERGGQARDIQVTIEEQPAVFGRLEDQFGLTVVDLDPALAERIGFPDQGALVFEVVKNSPAYRAGLQRWDLIVAVGNQPVATADQFLAAVQGADVSKGLVLVIEKPDGQRRLAVLGK